jgi:hypothetical protein
MLAAFWAAPPQTFHKSIYGSYAEDHSQTTILFGFKLSWFEITSDCSLDLRSHVCWNVAFVFAANPHD